MSRIAPKVIGVALALVGLLLTGAGSWFAAHLGGSGAATFTVRPTSGAPLVVDPAVLNRVDGPVRVTVTPAKGAIGWIGVAAPSDATAVLGGDARVMVTGVDVRSWTARTTTSGSGAPGTDLRTADVWARSQTGPGAVTMTLSQSDAPQTLVVLSENGRLATVTITWVHKAWFVQAVVGALIGLALLAGGALLLWTRPAPDDGITASSGSARLGVAA